MTGTPNRSRMAAPSSPGTREAPVPTTRSDDRSAESRSGWVITRAHWVGTPWATVIRSSTITEMAEAAFQGVGVITVVTPWTTSSQERGLDPTWAHGSGGGRGWHGPDKVSGP